MIALFLLAAGVVMTNAAAQPLKEEILTLNVVMHQQTCRAVAESFICTSEAPNIRRVTFALDPVTPDLLEEQAFVGTTPLFSLSSAAAGRYFPSLQVRKSVALGGSSVIYTLRFRVQPDDPSGGAKAYETVFIAADSLRMSEPLALMVDRQTPDGNTFRQVSFSAMLAVQFAELVPADLD